MQIRYTRIIKSLSTQIMNRDKTESDIKIDKTPLFIKQMKIIHNAALLPDQQRAQKYHGEDKLISTIFTKESRPVAVPRNLTNIYNRLTLKCCGIIQTDQNVVLGYGIEIITDLGVVKIQRKNYPQLHRVECPLFRKLSGVIFPMTLNSLNQHQYVSGGATLEMKNLTKTPGRN